MQIVKDNGEEYHLQVSVSDYYAPLSFQYDGDFYDVTPNVKYFDINTHNQTTAEIEFNVTSPEIYEISQEGTIVVVYNEEQLRFTLSPIEEYQDAGKRNQLKKLLEEKSEIVDDFMNKYSRFVQEGTWSSNDYIDSNLYYLDALQISNTSSQPKVTYTINVVEISELEGFEDYLFDAGDKTYIEDTEFFGWANKNGVLTPAREEVIVSEVEWHLDNPSENIITVQNYKTQFEDLFQRINATVQTVQYNEATYAKISSVLDADGTLNQDVLLESMINN